MSNFQPIEVVGRKTQLEGGENLNYLIQHFNG